MRDQFTRKFSSTMFSNSFISQVIEEKEEDQLSYCTYVIVTYGFLAAITGLACLIDDLTLVFGIIAGLAESASVFILPSIFYLISHKAEEKRLGGGDES